MTWTSATVQEFAAANGLQARVLAMPQDTHTAEDAARALGTDLAHIAKSLLAHLSDGRFVLCILRGDQRLDRKKLCRAAGAKHMSLAKADDVLRVTGYPVGAVPPFPLKSEVPAYMDPQVLEVDMVYCGGGDGDALLEVPTEELARVTRAEAVDLALT
ncbi:MAG: YbaK/EbsC family protein [Planctomycetota bacterium]|nr:YbaK/EbsC family protein [Planctomycetota bacterium]